MMIVLRGEVKFLTGGIVRELALQAERVKFPYRRYSPDGRSAILFCFACPDLYKIGVFCSLTRVFGNPQAPKEELCKSERRKSR